MFVPELRAVNVIHQDLDRVKWSIIVQYNACAAFVNHYSVCQTKQQQQKMVDNKQRTR